tara:strand:+ start:123 stop:278 length:156 start_codon:yes stop_codon:yes gene_type:complete
MKNKKTADLNKAIDAAYKVLCATADANYKANVEYQAARKAWDEINKSKAAA